MLREPLLNICGEVLIAAQRNYLCAHVLPLLLAALYVVHLPPPIGRLPRSGVSRKAQRERDGLARLSCLQHSW